jgi:hypothetical protein
MSKTEKEFKQKHLLDLVNKKDYSDHHLIGFSKAIDMVNTVVNIKQLKQLTSDSFLKVIFTGTNINVSQSLRFASEVKLYTLARQLRLGDSKQVEIFLNIFFNMDLVEKEIRELLYNDLVGPFRIIQYFVQAVYLDLSPSPSKVSDNL